MDCNLEMVCAAPHHGVTFYNVSACSIVTLQKELAYEIFKGA